MNGKCQPFGVRVRSGRFPFTSHLSLFPTLASPLRVTPDSAYELWKELRRRDVRFCAERSCSNAFKKENKLLRELGRLDLLEKRLP